MVLDKIPMKVFRYFVPSIVHLNNKFWYGGNRWFPYSDDSYWFNGSARGNERIWSHELWRRKVDSGWVFNYREKRKIRVILWRLMSFQTPFLFYEYKIEKLCFLKSIMLVKNERIPTFLKKTLVSESKKSWVITSVPGVAKMKFWSKRALKWGIRRFRVEITRNKSRDFHTSYGRTALPSHVTLENSI